eukprot:TRINITY_DN8518_c0_g1_i1.p1 TRINITY_DN8518_c0_g1~~TRINITY_DN8518_c0_g1_i1.p1  ORF type:complete len:162 (+),score=22.10 TRINITY_DN8518_c0_g1_i1:119-604(+)
MQAALEWSSLTNTSLFAGTALYVSLAVVPGILGFVSPALRAQAWDSMFRNVAPLQTATSIFGASSSLALWYKSGDKTFLYSGLLLAAMGPYTLGVMMPLVNNPLLSIAASVTSGAPVAPHLDALITKWSWFHAVRTVLGGVAVGLLFQYYISGQNKLTLFK